MTTAQLDSARMIPGAYERTDPRHRDSAAAAGPFVLTEDPRRAPRRQDAPYVVSASPRPTTWLAQSVDVLKDLALVIGVVFATALAPILAVHVIAMVVRLIAGAGRAFAERL